MKKRNPFLYVAVGKKGGGKTYTTDKKVLTPYAYGKMPKRVLIVDVNGEYTQYKTISLSNIELFSIHPKKEIRRIVPPASMSLDDVANMLLTIIDKYRDGALVIEDINAYVSDHLPADLVGTLIRLRHKGVDIIIHYQNIGRAGHPKILGNLNVLRVHKTTDDVDRHKNKYEDQYKIVKLAQTIVNNDFRKATTNEADLEILGTWVDLGGGRMEYKSAYVYVNFDTNKISGNFKKSHFYEACMDYINDNERDTIKPLLNRKDTKGKSVYNYEQAVEICLNDMFKEFYGNKR